jgi:hypothetical protein
LIRRRAAASTAASQRNKDYGMTQQRENIALVRRRESEFHYLIRNYLNNFNVSATIIHSCKIAPYKGAKSFVPKTLSGARLINTYVGYSKLTIIYAP